MKLLIILGLLSSCTFNFEKGKCYSIDTSKLFPYGDVYINGYFLQYNRFGDNKNRVYGSPEIKGFGEHLGYSEIKCPTKFLPIRRYNVKV